MQNLKASRHHLKWIQQSTIILVMKDALKQQNVLSHFHETCRKWSLCKVSSDPFESFNNGRKKKEEMQFLFWLQDTDLADCLQMLG